MARYKVFVTEEVERRVDVEADSPEDAEAQVRDRMENDDTFYILKGPEWRFTDSDTIDVEVWEND